MMGPRHPLNRLFFPSHLKLRSSLQAMPSMNTKSQLEVWGAPRSTTGRSGAGSVTSFQRLMDQYARAARRRTMVLR